MASKIRGIIKETIDCCFDCAEKGEAIMCEKEKLFDKCKVIDETIQAIYQVIEDVRPLNTMNTITHDGISHPHETEYDVIHNQALSDYDTALAKMFGREK